MHDDVVFLHDPWRHTKIKVPDRIEECIDAWRHYLPPVPPPSVLPPDIRLADLQTELESAMSLIQEQNSTISLLCGLLKNYDGAFALNEFYSVFGLVPAYMKSLQAQLTDLNGFVRDAVGRWQRPKTPSTRPPADHSSTDFLDQSSSSGSVALRSVYTSGLSECVTSEPVAKTFARASSGAQFSSDIDNYGKELFVFGRPAASNCATHFDMLQHALANDVFITEFACMLESTWACYKALLVTMKDDSFVERPYDMILADLRVVNPFHEALPEHGDTLLNRGELQNFCRRHSSQCLEDIYKPTSTYAAQHQGLPLDLSSAVKEKLLSTHAKWQSFNDDLLLHMKRYATDGKHEPIAEDFACHIEHLLEKAGLMHQKRTPMLDIIRLKVTEVRGSKLDMQWISELFFLLHKEMASDLAL